LGSPDDLFKSQTKSGVFSQTRYPSVEPAHLGRDAGLVREALDQLSWLAGLPLAGLDPARREAVAMELRARGGAAVTTLTCVVLQCYYRDDRVVRSLGLEPRPPHPEGHVLEDGDWSLLDPVRAPAPTWRRA
jgi:hypothetical protein